MLIDFDNKSLSWSLQILIMIITVMIMLLQKLIKLMFRVSWFRWEKYSDTKSIDDFKKSIDNFKKSIDHSKKSIDHWKKESIDHLKKKVLIMTDL